MLCLCFGDVAMVLEVVADVGGGNCGNGGGEVVLAMVVLGGGGFNVDGV